MHPVLVKIGDFTIHTYGFMIALGFLLALAVARALARRSNLDVERVLDLGFWSLLVGFAGSRILYVITQLDYFLADPIAVFRVWEGGLVFLGGPIAAVPFVIWYVKKHRLPFWRVGDAAIPGLALAQAFGRMGCIAAGCCYGKPTGTSFGIRFDSPLVDEEFRGVLLHPTQIYESSAMFLLFAGLIWTYRKRLFDGQVVFTYFMAYPVIRSFIEIFRGDLIRGFVIEGVLSTSQFISIMIFVVASFALVHRLKRLNSGETVQEVNAR